MWHTFRVDNTRKKNLCFRKVSLKRGWVNDTVCIERGWYLLADFRPGSIQFKADRRLATLWVEK